MKEMNIGKAFAIVKSRLHDDTITDKEKYEAIKTVARAETINGVFKADLLNAIRWIVDNYGIPEDAEGERNE